MKNLKNIPVVAMCAVLLAACASENSVGNYAIGDDSAAIKAGRNRAEARISRAELAQHRRQRQNVSEELALEREKRANKNDALRQGMGTAAGGLMLLNGVVGTVGVLKSVF
ncbi:MULTISPECIES: NGK_0946 family protein [Neisseria]|jgi:putative cheA signal transduction histidine kinase|uniref:NGK_0946 family protein n=1 Tax=Neisseria TaxID=482 RepID=UPI0016609FC0|nr:MULTISPECIES: hypothetical protein [Neisseria]MBD0764235.1 hypothetical protein [Neisseria sp. RH3002v2f]